MFYVTINQLAMFLMTSKLMAISALLDSTLAG